MEFIEKYPDKPWDWRDISQNPNITMEILKSILINLGIGGISSESKYHYGIY